jgi:predicted acetyltransferase
MMEAQLRDVADRGEPVAVLIAAEYPIYQRYGYGPATEACVVHLDADPEGWRDAPTGSVALVDAESLAPALIELYDRARRRAAGHISWDKQDWEMVAGARPPLDGGGGDPPQATRVLWRDPQGTVEGAAIYTVDGRWTHNRPDGELQVELLVAATDEAEREVARFLSTVDWVSKLRLWLRPVDDPLPLWRHDGRSVALHDQSDHIWARILDVPAALQRRRYDSPGRLTFEVVDAMGYAGGRYLLEAGPDGASCQPTQAEPELVMPVEALGAAYLGGHTWGRLSAAGWVDERRPGAVDTASALFATARAPWCPRTF